MKRILVVLVGLSLAACSGSSSSSSSGGSGTTGGSTASSASSSTTGTIGSSTGSTASASSSSTSTASSSSSTSTGSSGSGTGTSGSTSSGSSGSGASSGSGGSSGSSGSGFAVTAVGTPFDPNDLSHQAGSALIGPGGGVLSADYGRIVLNVPPGALSAPTQIDITPITNNAPGGLGAAYRLTPDGQSFAVPVTLTFFPFEGEAEDATVVGAAFQTLDGRWKALADMSFDSSSGSFNTTTDHFTDYSFWTHVFAIADSTALFSGDNTNIQIGSFELLPDTDGDYLPQGATYYDASQATNWSVNGVPDGDAVNGTVMAIGNVGNYQAPASPPSQNPVAVSAQLTLGGVQLTFVANIHVLAHVYRVTPDLHAISTCNSGGGGGPSTSFDIGNTGSVDITLDSTFNIASFSPGPSSNAIVSGFGSCVPQCTAAMHTPVPGLEIGDANGGYLPGLHRIRVGMGGLWTDTPGFDLNCQGSSSSQQAVQEDLSLLDFVPHDFVGYDGEVVHASSQNGFSATDFTWTLTVVQP